LANSCGTLAKSCGADMNQLFTDLCAVKALIVAGWGQGECRDRTHLCPVDAIWQIAGRSGPRTDALQNAMYAELARTTGDLRIGFVDWNDAPERTKADVIDLIQRAANRAGGGDVA
jgi:hypothetical protein